MQTIRVRFDRIFDVVRYSGKGAHTDFGFQSVHMKQCGARVDGLPLLREGMEVTAVLKDADDWASVLGWYDHSTGEVFVAGTGYALIISIVAIGLSLPTTYVAFAKNSQLWFPDVVFIVIAISAIVDLHQRMKARSILKSLAKNSMMTPTDAE